MSARRRDPGARWSAGASLHCVDASGSRLAEGAPATARVVVRWRLDGKGRKATFAGPSAIDEARRLAANLAAASANGWDADGDHRPVVPGTGAAPGVTGGDDVLAEGATIVPLRRVSAPAVRAADQLAGSELPRLAVPVGREEQPFETVADVVAWHRARLKSTAKRSGGQKRSPITLDDYKSALGFFTTIAVYRPGDPRLEALGLEPGAPLRVDDPATGINADDLIGALAERESTNLRIRAQNERAMTRWATAVDREERRAAREGRDPVIPGPPQLRPEVVTGRTIEAFGRAVKALFVTAVRHQKMSYQPWTAAVDDCTVSAGPIRYSTKAVARPEHVRRIADAMRALERNSKDAHNRPITVTGERFEALVLLAGTKAPRPEETIAIRDSWVRLDGDEPAITLHGAEAYHPMASGAGRVRVEVALKHRPAGETRTLDLRGHPDLVEALRLHRERFVAEPDPEGEDPERRDPHFFTTHLGKPIDLSNWGTNWWKPTVAAALSNPADRHLADMPFRLLRASSITEWLRQGRTLFSCAREAGNSQAVIEKHYAGVLHELGYDPEGGPGSRRAESGSAVLPSDPDALAALGNAELAALWSGVKEELHSRS